MTIIFQCECGKKFHVKAELAGRRGKCKFCGTIMRIPPVSEQPLEPFVIPEVVDDPARAAGIAALTTSVRLVCDHLQPSMNSDVYVDGVWVGSLAHRNELLFQVAPGKHDMQVGKGRSAALMKVAGVPGEQLVWRVAWAANRIRLSFVASDSQLAERPKRTRITISAFLFQVLLATLCLGLGVLISLPVVLWWLKSPKQAVDTAGAFVVISVVACPLLRLAVHLVGLRYDRRTTEISFAYRLCWGLGKSRHRKSQIDLIDFP